MVHCQLGLATRTHQNTVPELPTNLNLFYNQNRANSDTSNFKKQKEEGRIGQVDLELRKPRVLVDGDKHVI